MDWSFQRKHCTTIYFSSISYRGFFRGYQCGEEWYYKYTDSLRILLHYLKYDSFVEGPEYIVYIYTLFFKVDGKCFFLKHHNYQLIITIDLHTTQFIPHQKLEIPAVPYSKMDICNFIGKTVSLPNYTISQESQRMLLLLPDNYLLALSYCG